MMRPALVSFTAALLLVGCSSAEGNPEPTEAPSMSNDSTPSSNDAQTDTATAFFAGGCFWGVEHYMEQLDGVIEVESGYMGGHIENPSYEQVSSQTSGHYETVRVTYDPKRVAYKAIAKRFFEIHDPTQKDGQGPDIGPEYESAVFFSTPAEKADVEELITLLEKKGLDVATTLKPADTFYRAEDYHQDYYQRKGSQPYCHARVKRFD